MDKELLKLTDEVDQLRKRVAFLEQQMKITEDIPKEVPNVKPAAAVSTDTEKITDTHKNEKEVRYYKPKEKKALHRMSEEKLAGTLFNRLGILAIMIAARSAWKNCNRNRCGIIIYRSR